MRGGREVEGLGRAHRRGTGAEGEMTTRATTTHATPTFECMPSEVWDPFHILQLPEPEGFVNPSGTRRKNPINRFTIIRM